MPDPAPNSQHTRLSTNTVRAFVVSRLLRARSNWNISVNSDLRKRILSKILRITTNQPCSLNANSASDWPRGQSGTTVLSNHASLVLYSPTALIDVQNVSRFLEIAHDATHKKVVHIVALTHLNKRGKHKHHSQCEYHQWVSVRYLYRVNRNQSCVAMSKEGEIYVICCTCNRCHTMASACIDLILHTANGLRCSMRNKVSLRTHPQMISKAHISVEIRLHIGWCATFAGRSVCQITEFYGFHFHRLGGVCVCKPKQNAMLLLPKCTPISLR